MKCGDMEKVLVEKEEYAKNHVHKGMIGMLTDSEIWDTEIMVIFPIHILQMKKIYIFQCMLAILKLLKMDIIQMK